LSKLLSILRDINLGQDDRPDQRRTRNLPAHLSGEVSCETVKTLNEFMRDMDSEERCRLSHVHVYGCRSLSSPLLSSANKLYYVERETRCEARFG
jgi:hypothetical protein